MSPSDQLEELLGQYWDAAWMEGKGESTCIDPNFVLYKIRALFNASRAASFGGGDGCTSDRSDA
jgi:hypothetical protein